MVGGTRAEYDNGLPEAGVHQEARGAGEHRNSADEGGLFVGPEAAAAAGGEQDAGDAAHVWRRVQGCHKGNGSRPRVD